MVVFAFILNSFVCITHDFFLFLKCKFFISSFTCALLMIEFTDLHTFFTSYIKYTKNKSRDLIFFLRISPKKAPIHFFFMCEKRKEKNLCFFNSTLVKKNLPPFSLSFPFFFVLQLTNSFFFSFLRFVFFEKYSFLKKTFVF